MKQKETRHTEECRVQFEGAAQEDQGKWLPTCPPSMRISLAVSTLQCGNPSPIHTSQYSKRYNCTCTRVSSVEPDRSGLNQPCVACAISFRSSTSSRVVDRVRLMELEIVSTKGEKICCSPECMDKKPRKECRSVRSRTRRASGSAEGKHERRRRQAHVMTNEKKVGQ